YPFLKTLLAEDNNQKQDVNIVDIGGGSGIFLRHIWKSILSKDSNAKRNWNLNGTIVGLRVQNPMRHFSEKSVKENMAYMAYQQKDYIDWIDRQTGTFQFDIALMCRLLNNLSIFDIKYTDDEGKLWYISGQNILPEIIVSKMYNPVHSLCPEKYFPENLIQTNGKTRLSENCVAYRVLSLADYYKAIASCLGMNVGDEMFFYPVRKFNENSLLNSKGGSIISKLLGIVKLTIIEDVDLTINYLIKHVQSHKLNSMVSIINVDSQYSSQILAICDKKYESMLPGKKICQK
ncbi:MAG: hypothetical protein PHQ00_03075, partial [Phycisphaerae bacterium]|nr:hypothetical protein [Phycisphaerae bacterium]